MERLFSQLHEALWQTWAKLIRLTAGLSFVAAEHMGVPM
jgi:predicted membrane protein